MMSSLLLLACSGPPEPPADCSASGVICTWAGTPGTASFGADGVPATESGLYLPIDLTFHPQTGEGYLIDWNNHRIRRVTEDGTVQTVAGSGFLGDGPEGDARQAAFNHPTDLAFHPDDPDLMAIAAWHNSRLEVLDLAASTIAWVGGTGDRDYTGPGPALEASLDLPSSVAWDPPTGLLYFMDQANQMLRALDPDGVIRDIGGRQRDPGYEGDGGPVSRAKFHASVGQAADPSNRILVHDGRLYMVDSGNPVVRVVDLATERIDRLAGTASLAGGYAGDGGDALAAEFSTPRDLAMGPDGELYVADTDNSCVRVIAPDGVVETFAGTCTEPGFDGDGHEANDAQLDHPFGIAVDLEGNVYIADTLNHVIRRVSR
jgi:DNA-binding beta-propeller fold protein YncE